MAGLFFLRGKQFPDFPPISRTPRCKATPTRLAAAWQNARSFMPPIFNGPSADDALEDFLLLTFFVLLFFPRGNKKKKDVKLKIEANRGYFVYSSNASSSGATGESTLKCSSMTVSHCGREAFGDAFNALYECAFQLRRLSQGTAFCELLRNKYIYMLPFRIALSRAPLRSESFRLVRKFKRLCLEEFVHRA